MSGAKFVCKECKYVWRTKKDVGRPAFCPRCSSKRIIFDNLTNNKIGWIIGITGIGLFLMSKTNPPAIPMPLGNLAGLIGFLLLFIIIAITLDNRQKNKRILNAVEQEKNR